MGTPTSNSDLIVEQYLRAVEKQLTGVPATQRTELLSDLSVHIDSSREALTEETEAQVRQILERLGSPETVAAAARQDVQGTDAPHRPLVSRRIAMLIGIVVVAILVLALVIWLAFLNAGHSSITPGVTPS